MGPPMQGLDDIAPPLSRTMRQPALAVADMPRPSWAGCPRPPSRWDSETSAVDQPDAAGTASRDGVG